MSSKRGIRRRECGSKVRYPNHETATGTAKARSYATRASHPRLSVLVLRRLAHWAPADTRAGELETEDRVSDDIDGEIARWVQQAKRQAKFKRLREQVFRNDDGTPAPWPALAGSGQVAPPLTNRALTDAIDALRDPGYLPPETRAYLTLHRDRMIAGELCINWAWVLFLRWLVASGRVEP